jgi:hypothetical protein
MGVEDFKTSSRECSHEAFQFTAQFEETTLETPSCFKYGLAGTARFRNSVGRLSVKTPNGIIHLQY